MQEDVKVIYISGYGRSGSTVLDTVVGNHEHVESVGELINAPRAWSNRDEFCACGDRAHECAFWSAIQNEWRASLPPEARRIDWPSVQAMFERPRHLGRTLKQGKEPSSTFKTYSAGIVALYKAIQKVSGKPVVLDSSKNPVRALALSLMPEIQLRLIHLVRDGRGVAWSLKKPYRKDPAKGLQRELRGKPVIRTTLSWWLNNKMSELAYSRIAADCSMRVRYEDLTSKPHEVLDDIGILTGLDFGDVTSRLASEGGFNIGHTIAGNRLRMARQVRLRADIEWKDRLSPFDQALFWFIAGRMAMRYGYHRSMKT